MEPAAFRLIASVEGMRLLDSIGPLPTTESAVAELTHLRRGGVDAALAAAVVTQARLRTRAEAKFGPFAKRMLFSDSGLQQASRLSVSAHHAGRFRAAGLLRIADLGCGIGGDALAFAGIGLQVDAIERDEVTAAIATHNLAPFETAQVHHTSAEEWQLGGADAVWLDPARRNDSRRLRDPSDWSPPLSFAFGTADRIPSGIKLAPAIDRALIPSDAEAQWVSNRGEVVELAVWSRELERPGIRRAALVLSPDGAAELTGPAAAPDAPVGALGRYLVEPDGAVIRAQLIGDLARRLQARMLHQTIAYLATDELLPTPFGTFFAVEADLPLDAGKLRKEMRARGIGSLEIKKRGVDIDPATFRKELALRGDESATLILTRIGERRRAILTSRLKPVSATTDPQLDP